MNIMWITAMKIGSDFDFENAMSNIRSSGAWIMNMASRLAVDEKINEFHIISINKFNKVSEKKKNKFTIYGIKANPMNFVERRKIHYDALKIIRNVNPDLIDIQGIEFVFSDVEYPCCLIHTIQGIPFELYKYQLMQYKLRYKSLRWNSIKGFCTLRFLWIQNILMHCRAKIGKKIISQEGYYIGRTEWDKAIVENYNSLSKYHSVNRILRDEFYHHRWDIKRAKNNVLFTIGFSSINKGFDIFIDALNIVVKNYPDIKVYVLGDINCNPICGKWYDRYIANKISKYDLGKNLEFVGNSNAMEICNYLLMSRVFVSPSVNENSSNAIGEAQMLGVPVIAAFTGGNTSYVKHEYSGLLYNPWDENMCAHEIIRVLEQNDLCEELSMNEYMVSHERHDYNKAIDDLKEAYNIFYEDYSKKTREIR